MSTTIWRLDPKPAIATRIGMRESMGRTEGATRAEWAQGLLRAARDRLREAAPQL
ncbi:hypothetical protein ABZ770_04125 [Streptomyces sp. NPDC006654]|uniref:hypothetical protein n=1 Tax=unclassified Streptomyces TaxID=2593676 RepID=UPI0033C4FF9C